MAIPHGVVLAAALVALLCLPCAAAVLFSADQLAIERSARRFDTATARLRAWSRGDSAARRRGWRERDGEHVRSLVELERGPILPPVAGPAPCREQIVAELRRLDRQRRHGPATGSVVWSAAVLVAYDAWLGLACREFGVAEHLRTLRGMDRDIERVRIEGELQTSGLTFGDT